MQRNVDTSPKTLYFSQCEQEVRESEIPSSNILVLLKSTFQAEKGRYHKISAEHYLD